MKADSRAILVPMVAGSRGGCAPPSSAHAEMRRGHLPYIPLASPPDLDCGGAFCFGRAEILTSTFAACGCLPSLCCHCEEANGWGVRFLSRRMLRLLPDRDNEEERGDRVSFRAQIRGENASRTVLVDGRPILGRRKRGEGGTGDWIGGCLVRPGSVVSFAHPEHQGRGQGGGRDGRILSFQMHVQAGAGRSGSAEPKFVPSYTRSGAASALPHSVVDLCPSNEPNMSPSSSAPHSVVDLCSSSSPPHPSVSPSAPPSRRLSCVVYLLERGRGMPRSRVDLLRRTLTEKEGVSVADSFTSSARFVVIDDNVTAQGAAAELGFASATEMAQHLMRHKIYAVTPSWVFSGGSKIFQEPSPDMMWTALRPVNEKRHDVPDCKPKEGWMTRIRSIDEIGPVKTVKASSIADDEAVVARILKKRKRMGAIEGAPSRQLRKRLLNGALARMFTEMADLQRASPLTDMDQWRAYTYSLVAGRLGRIEFEVTENEDILGSLKGIRGFGNAVINKIREYFATGTCQKLEALRNDPNRAYVRNLTQIWGVGPKKVSMRWMADLVGRWWLIRNLPHSFCSIPVLDYSQAAELIRANYRTIQDVRTGLELGELDLSANARIGVQYYEEFMEKIGRVEVCNIFKVVAAAVKKLYPEAECTTMGSFRRGKQQCGDVDVLIVHPRYYETTPHGALLKIVRSLEKNGYVSHHLAGAKGLDSSSPSAGSERSAFWESEDAKGNAHITTTAPRTTDGMSNINDAHRAASWMGVWIGNRGKHRRVDIKFYPYQERIFAALYFTGSGEFNRSMRLWARKVSQFNHLQLCI